MAAPADRATAVADALRNDRTVDITTTGRKSGRRARIEIWFHVVAGTVYPAGPPGRRDWYANLLHHPRFTFHVKESVRADVPAIARPVLDEPERGIVVTEIAGRLGVRDPEAWLAGAPLIAVAFQGPAS